MLRTSHLLLLRKLPQYELYQNTKFFFSYLSYYNPWIFNELQPRGSAGGTANREN